MPLVGGMPRWQKIGTFLILGGIFFLGVLIYVRVGGTNEAVNATNQSSARRDCVTTLSTARTSVFYDVLIDGAVSTKLLNDALLAGVAGTPLAPDQLAVILKQYAENNTALTSALTEARRIQPAQVLDDLIAHGGDIAGRHYDACPA